MWGCDLTNTSTGVWVPGWGVACLGPLDRWPSTPLQWPAVGGVVGLEAAPISTGYPHLPQADFHRLSTGAATPANTLKTLHLWPMYLWKSCGNPVEISKSNGDPPRSGPQTLDLHRLSSVGQTATHPPGRRRTWWGGGPGRGASPRVLDVWSRNPLAHLVSGPLAHSVCGPSRCSNFF